MVLLANQFYTMLHDTIVHMLFFTYWQQTHTIANKLESIHCYVKFDYVYILQKLLTPECWSGPDDW